MDEAARFLGVDVGTSRLLATSIDFTVDPPIVRFAPSTEHGKVVDWIRSAEPTSVAIDAPAGWNKGLRRREGRRVVDALFGVGGLYGTPASPSEAPAWMQASVALHEQLKGVLGDDRVFEVHPTSGFRSLLGVHFATEPERVVCDPKHRLLPRRPRSRGGQEQRVALLAALLSEWGVVMPSDEALEDVDRVDALMGACLGCLRARGQIHQVGDPRDGLVVIASDRDMSQVLDELPAPSRLSRPSLASVPPRGSAEDIDGFALPLGDRGPGGLDLERTLETLATHPEGNGFFPVTLPRRLGGTDRPPPFDLILYSNLGNIPAMRAMLRVTHVYTPQDGLARRDLLGERDPWPLGFDAEKTQWLEYEHAVLRESDLDELIMPDAPPSRTGSAIPFSWLPGARPSAAA